MTSPEIPFDSSLFDLFCAEIQTHTKIIYDGLIEIEKNPKDQSLLESLMRAAHSIKGAARVIHLQKIVQLTHAMENCFEISEKENHALTSDQIDHLLKVTDFLSSLSQVHVENVEEWLSIQKENIDLMIDIFFSLKGISSHAPVDFKSLDSTEGIIKSASEIKELDQPSLKDFKETKKLSEKKSYLRLSAERLSHLMGLAGESLVESRWLDPFGKSLQGFKYRLKEIDKYLSLLRINLEDKNFEEKNAYYLSFMRDRLNALSVQMNERIREFDHFTRRYARLADRLYHEIAESRMRPFTEAVEGLPRLVRDLARELGKKARLEVGGESTLVDKEIIDKLQSPLNHLIRNAIDHGIEFPERRLSMGKEEEGVINITARHHGGRLEISVGDDGQGISKDVLKNLLIEKHLIDPKTAGELSDSELLEFLFLPGFSTSTQLTEVSGRGIGLNAVKEMVLEVGGNIKIHAVEGKGVVFFLNLPLTLFVIRALIVEISRQPFAFPLAQIDKVIQFPKEKIQTNNQFLYYSFEDQKIPLIFAWKLFDFPQTVQENTELSLILLSNESQSFGLIVDRLIGEKELVVHEPDRQLGKISLASGRAILEDGSPVLIVDTEELMMFVETRKELTNKSSLTDTMSVNTDQRKKEILVVEDSFLFREVESNFLKNQGYFVDIANDGYEGLQAARNKTYDLIITDLEMPRMNGLNLLKAIKSDSKIQSTPVMVVTSSESEEVKKRALEAGAQAFMSKRGFIEKDFIDCVNNLLETTK